MGARVAEGSGHHVSMGVSGSAVNFELDGRESVVSEAPEYSDAARSLLRSSVDALLDPQVLLEAVRDSHGRVLDLVYRELNQATCDYLGLSRADLLGHGLLETTPGLAEAGLFAACVRCVDSGESVSMDDLTYENEILADTRHYDLRATRAAPNAITLTWRDVTDRVQLLQRATESEARFRLLMDTAAVAMSVSGPDGKFQSVNAAVCDFLGYDTEILMQMTWEQLTAPEYIDADLATIKTIMTRRIDSYRTTKQFIHADGHRVWGNMSVSCLRTPNGEVDQFITQIVDITGEVELAERLKVQSDRLAAELRSAAEYVSSIMPADLVGRVQVCSRYLPSQGLAGDTFDYRWVDDDHLIVYLLDVSGHGIEPALLSVSVHNMLRSGTVPLATLLAPEQVLSKLNKRFQMDKQNDHFFTMWFGVYEASTRTLRYASAGAPPVFALESESAAAALSADGAPIGMFPDTVFTSHTYPVPHGCRILLYSDGAYEIALDDGRLLSLEDFKDTVIRLAGSSLDDLVDTLRGLTPSGAFDDDCSLIRLDFD